MTNLYQKFKKLNKEEVLDIGQYYSVDKEGFAKFLEETWNEEKESTCDFARALITVVALMSKGIIDSSLKNHLINAKKNGISKKEMAEIITHAAFYAGWPNAWAVFRMAKEIYEEGE